jgi:sugar lactone lactonase YvrE
MPEIVVSGIAFPEGLGWSASDQTLLCSGVQEAAVYRVFPKEGRKERIVAFGAGGANNLVLASDGGSLVAQNGGVDANLVMPQNYPEMDTLPECIPTTPGLMHLSPDGDARYVIDAGVNAPNDVAAAADGTLYFTDPGNPFFEVRATPRVMRLSTAGELSALAEGDFDYCNGIVVDGEGLLVTDHGGVWRIGFDGSREWAVQFEGGVDGIALDVDGRMYVAGSGDGIVRVFEDGTLVETLMVAERGLITNCSFGGPELRDLYVTDAVSGTVSVFASMPTAGAPVHPWPAPVAAKRA